MVPAVGLALACVSAVLVFSRTAFTTAKILGIVPSLLLAAHWHPWRKSPLVKPALVYAACWLPALLWTQSLALSVFGYPKVFSGSLLTLAMCAGGALLAEQLEVGVEWVERTVLWAASLTAIASFAQRCGVDPFAFGDLPLRRAVGLLGSPVDAGALFVVILTYAPKRFWPLHLAGLWSTASRASWVGGLVAMVPRRWRALPFVLAAVLGLLLVSVDRHPSESDLGRWAMWDVAARHIKVLGTGPATFALTFRDHWDPETDMAKYGLHEKLNPVHAHNAILEALVTRGLLGLESLAVIMWAAPELMGFWLVCLFDPVSFEVVFLACVLAGLSRNPNRKEIP